MTFPTDIPGAEVLPTKKFWAGRLPAWPVSGVVQHYTASVSEQGLVKWMASDSSNSAHIFIFRNGHIVQMVRFADRAFHAGEKQGQGFWGGKPQPTNVNHFTIGIENCNAGWLLKQGSDFFLPVKGATGFVPGSRYKGPAPKEAPDHRGVVRWWEPYSDKLVASNIEVLKRIVDLYPAVTREQVQFHSDVAPHRKTDPGPLWPHEYVLSEVFGGASAPASTVAATAPADDAGEVAALTVKRQDNNEDGENPEWHYDYDAQMSMVDRVDGQCRDE